MAKPPTSVRSIRLPDATWVKLAKRAEETGLSVNALVAAGADLAATMLIHRSDIEFEAKLAMHRATASPPSDAVKTIAEAWKRPALNPPSKLLKRSDKITLAPEKARGKATIGTGRVVYQAGVRAAGQAVHAAVPTFERKAFNPQPKKGRVKG